MELGTGFCRNQKITNTLAAPPDKQGVRRIPMINSVNNSSQVGQSYQLQQNHQSSQTQKNSQNDQQPEDTVVLSKKATESNDSAQSGSDQGGH
jgi:hypothetical protein